MAEHSHSETVWFSYFAKRQHVPFLPECSADVMHHVHESSVNASEVVLSFIRSLIVRRPTKPLLYIELDIVCHTIPSFTESLWKYYPHADCLQSIFASLPPFLESHVLMTNSLMSWEFGKQSTAWSITFLRVSSITILLSIRGLLFTFPNAWDECKYLLVNEFTLNVDFLFQNRGTCCKLSLLIHQNNLNTPRI